jgi:hypothetical protein
MKKGVILGVFAAVLCGVSGCGSSPDGIVKDNIAAMNEVSTALDSIKDDASADAAIPKIQKGMQRLKDNTKKLEEMKMSEEDKKKLMEANDKPMKEAMEKMLKAGFSGPAKAPNKAKEIMNAMKGDK